MHSMRGCPSWPTWQTSITITWLSHLSLYHLSISHTQVSIHIWFSRSREPVTTVSLCWPATAMPTVSCRRRRRSLGAPPTRLQHRPCHCSSPPLRGPSEAIARCSSPRRRCRILPGAKSGVLGCRVSWGTVFLHPGTTNSTAWLTRLLRVEPKWILTTNPSVRMILIRLRMNLITLLKSLIY